MSPKPTPPVRPSVSVAAKGRSRTGISIIEVRVSAMGHDSPIPTWTARGLTPACYAVDAAASGPDDTFLEEPVSVTELQEAASLLLFEHTLGPASNPCAAAVTRGISPVVPSDLPTDLRAPQQPSESAGTRSINIDLSVEDAIAADIARDDAIAAAIERRDRRTDPTT